MRNIPFAFIDEETIERVTRAEQRHQESVNAFANLAATQQSVRGLVPVETSAGWFNAAKSGILAMLEKTMRMSGPNSIANLERALRAPGRAPRHE